MDMNQHLAFLNQPAFLNAPIVARNIDGVAPNARSTVPTEMPSGPNNATGNNIYQGQRISPETMNAVVRAASRPASTAISSSNAGSIDSAIECILQAPPRFSTMVTTAPASRSDALGVRESVIQSTSIPGGTPISHGSINSGEQFCFRGAPLLTAARTAPKRAASAALAAKNNVVHNINFPGGASLNCGSINPNGQFLFQGLPLLTAALSAPTRAASIAPENFSRNSRASGPTKNPSSDCGSNGPTPQLYSSQTPHLDGATVETMEAFPFPRFTVKNCDITQNQKRSRETIPDLRSSNGPSGHNLNQGPSLSGEAFNAKMHAAFFNFAPGNNARAHPSNIGVIRNDIDFERTPSNPGSNGPVGFLYSPRQKPSNAGANGPAGHAFQGPPHAAGLLPRAVIAFVELKKCVCSVGLELYFSGSSNPAEHCYFQSPPSAGEALAAATSTAYQLEASELYNRVHRNSETFVGTSRDTGASSPTGLLSQGSPHPRESLLNALQADFPFAASAIVASANQNSAPSGVNQPKSSNGPAEHCFFRSPESAGEAFIAALRSVSFPVAPELNNHFNQNSETTLGTSRDTGASGSNEHSSRSSPHAGEPLLDALETGSQSATPVVEADVNKNSSVSRGNQPKGSNGPAEHRFIRNPPRASEAMTAAIKTTYQPEAPELNNLANRNRGTTVGTSRDTGASGPIGHSSQGSPQTRESLLNTVQADSSFAAPGIDAGVTASKKNTASGRNQQKGPNGLAEHCFFQGSQSSSEAFIAALRSASFPVDPVTEPEAVADTTDPFVKYKDAFAPEENETEVYKVLREEAKRLYLRELDATIPALINPADIIKIAYYFDDSGVVPIEERVIAESRDGKPHLRLAPDRDAERRQIF